jgi:hypothetical protein
MITLNLSANQAVIYQQSPAGLSYRAGLAESEARFLQTIAAETALAGFVP